MPSTEPEAPSNNETSLHAILLVVEDDEAIGELIAQVVQEETPYTVLTVPNAFQALEVVTSITPILFILDYQLPDVNGLELADRLRSIEGLDTVPTLLVSANPPPLKEIRQRKMALLKKPFDLSKLVTTIEGLLSEQAG